MQRAAPRIDHDSEGTHHDETRSGSPRRTVRTVHKNRYSAAIRSGDLLLVPGQVGRREDGSPEADIAAQTRQAFDTLGAVLAAAGCTFRHGVDVTTFHVDPENRAGVMIAVKDQGHSLPRHPNWTAVGATWLSGFRFETKAIARIPDTRRADDLVGRPDTPIARTRAPDRASHGDTRSGSCGDAW